MKDAEKDPEVDDEIKSAGTTNSSNFNQRTVAQVGVSSVSPHCQSENISATNQPVKYWKSYRYWITRTSDDDE